MAKIVRKTAKLFGVNAGATGIEEFASKEQGGAIVYSTDPAALQTAFWSLGWTPAQYQGVFAPYFQDRNAVDLVAFYQLAYILQQGIPEWDSATPYFLNSWVQYGGQLFVSQQDNNSGNIPPASASNAFWSYVNGSTAPLFPTRTVLLSGTGLYTPPAGCLRLFVRMVGAGGGGQSYNSFIPSSIGGVDGTDTTFGPLTAGGGKSSPSGNPLGGLGGVASGGDLNLGGARGCQENGFVGGAGGCSKFGGCGVFVSSGENHSAAPNTGSGGGGTSGSPGTAGGGAGAYVEKTIYGPSLAGYMYAVGIGGPAANSSEGKGADGADGIIIIDEYFL